MSIPVSTVPAVKFWLQQKILAAVTAEPEHGLEVVLDDPGPVQMDDIIAVGNVAHRQSRPYQMIGSLGAGSMLEEYEMMVMVSVFRGGPDQMWPFTRAWALAAVVESVVRTDPTLGGAAIVAYPNGSKDQSEWQPQHMGRLVEVEVMIHVEAQI